MLKTRNTVLHVFDRLKDREMYGCHFTSNLMTR